MTKLPGLKAREVIKGLENSGFEKVRHKGSHAIFHHPDCRRVSIPIHPFVDQPEFVRVIIDTLIKIRDPSQFRARIVFRIIKQGVRGWSNRKNIKVPSTGFACLPWV